MFISHSLPFCSRCQSRLPDGLVEKLRHPNRDTTAFREALNASLATLAEREKVAAAG